MMDSIIELISFGSQSLIRASWHGALAVGCATLIETCWSTMPATWRSWMWRIVFLKTTMALVPFSFSLPLLPMAQPTVVPTVEAIPTTQVTPTSLELLHSQPTIAYLQLALAIVWVAGFSTCVLALWREAKRLRVRLTSSRQIVDAAYLKTMRDLSNSMKISNPRLHGMEYTGSPCLASFKRRPILLLPMQWLRGCSRTQMRLAIAHELAHYARGDLGWNRFVAICRAVLFFHPAIWFASRRYLAAQELACDAIALKHTLAAPSQLANLLIKFTDQPSVSWAGSVAMTGTYSRTRERIASMFRFQQSPSRITAWSLSCLAFLFLLPVSLSAQSTSTLREEKAPYPKSNSGIRAYATASAFARGGAYSNNSMGRYGNQYGNAWAGARAQAGVSTFPNSYGRAYPRREQLPTRSSKRAQNKSNSFSSVQQRMNSIGNSNGVWSRSFQSSINGETVTVEETQNQVTVTVERNDGTREKSVAADLKELSDKSPEAAELYRKTVQTMPKANNWNAFRPMDARQMLRDQIETMKAEHGFGHQPFMGMFDEMLRQLP